MKKPESGLRYADVLVIEEGALAGGPPRVETFSFKSRNFSGLEDDALMAQMVEDAREALRKYGGTLDIRRDSLQPLLRGGSEVPVQRVRLVYEGGELKPTKAKDLKTAMDETRTQGSGSGGAVPMKVLEFHECEGRRTTSGSPSKAPSTQERHWRRELEPFFHALEEYAGEWMPDVVKGKRRRKYTRAAIWKALEERRDEKQHGPRALSHEVARVGYVAPARLSAPRLPNCDITFKVKPLSFFAEAERCRKLRGDGARLGLPLPGLACRGPQQ